MNWVEHEALSLMKFMGEQGARFRPYQLQRIKLYFENMIVNDRVITIEDGDKFHGFLCISCTDNENEFLKKDDWVFFPHNPRGKVCVIEKIVVDNYDKSMRRLIEDIIIEINPHVESAVWYRWAKHGDRRVIARRKNYVRS